MATRGRRRTPAYDRNRRSTVWASLVFLGIAASMAIWFWTGVDRDTSARRERGATVDVPARYEPSDIDGFASDLVVGNHSVTRALGTCGENRAWAYV